MDNSEISPLKNFDKKLQQFYYDVLGQEVNLNIMWKAHSIRRALIEIKKHKKRLRRKSDVRFDTASRRCAYLLKYGPCLTSAVAKYFHTLVSGRQDLIENAFKNGEFAICCLGGGPATDAVALVHIIRYLYEPYWRKYRKTLKISITVVDIGEEWQETARNVLECLQITPEFFGDGELTLTYEFLTADLTKEMSKDLKTAIKSADILTMIYFLSSVIGPRGRETIENMVEKVMLSMKKGAIVFFLDSAKDECYEVLYKVSEKRNEMLQIYGPLIEELHTVTIESVKSFLDLYAKHFYRLICKTFLFSCVSTWLKPMVKDKRKYINREMLHVPPPSWRKPTDEESEDLIQKMKQFCSLVNKLINKRFNSAFKVKSYNGFRKEMLSSRHFEKNAFEKQKVDSKTISKFVSSRNVKTIDLEIGNSYSSNNFDFESSRNFGKIISTDNSGFASSRNIGKTDLTTNRDFMTFSNLGKISSTSISDFSRSRNFRKTGLTSNSDFASCRNFEKTDSLYNSDFSSSRNFRKTGLTSNSDFASCRNFEKTDSLNNSDFASSRNFRKIISTNNSDLFGNSRNLGKLGLTSNGDFVSSRSFIKKGSRSSDLASSRNFGETDSMNNSDFASSRYFRKTGRANQRGLTRSRNLMKYNFENLKTISTNDSVFESVSVTKQKWSQKKPPENKILCGRGTDQIDSQSLSDLNGWHF